MGLRYVAAINQIEGAESLQDLFALRRLDLHPLRDNRAGQYALRLTGQVRLVVTVHDERTLTVEEVVDYHG